MSCVSKSIQTLPKVGHVYKNTNIKWQTTAAKVGTATATKSIHISPPLSIHRSFSGASSKNQRSSTNSIFTTISSSLLKLKSRYSINAQKDRVIQASCLFQAIKHQAHNSKWYLSSSSSSSEDNNDGRNIALTPDFRQIHAILSMHVWFIHRRLYAENRMLSDSDPKKNDNLLLQEELFDIFWNDTTARIRAQEVNELTVNKHLKDAQQATFLHCTQYDHAFEEYPHDVEKRFEIICDAVWKHVLSGEEDADDELIRKIGAYVEYQLQNIVYQLPDDYFHEGRIAWGNIPDLNNDGGSDDDKLSGPLRGMNFLENNWVQVITIAGDPYYWNMDSNETRWGRP